MNGWQKTIYGYQLIICLVLWLKVGIGAILSSSVVDSATSVHLYEELTNPFQEKLTELYSNGSIFVKEAGSSAGRFLQSVGPVPLPYRINCGETTKNYTDPKTGKTWLLERFFSQGGPDDGCPNAIKRNVSISNHLCLTRNGFNFTYNVPVPFQGNYKVTLYFVETFFSNVGRRVFNVSVEGIKVLTNLDVFGASGGVIVPLNRTYTVAVTDGFLTLQLLSSIDRATISAIEIEDGRAQTPAKRPTPKPVLQPPTPSPPTPPLSTVRINCGGTSTYIDPLTNNVWAADVNFQNGSRYTVCPAEIFNTSIDTVFCSERWFGGGQGINGTYTIPVVPGRYTIRLLFAELYFNTPGSRIFNVYLQSRIIRRNLDIRAVTGGRNISLSVPAIATVSSLDPNVRVTLQTVAQNAKISGIEIIPYDGSVTDTPTYQPTRQPTRAPTNVYETILINCGYNLPFTDSLARVFSPDQFFIGGTTASKLVPIANTVDDTLYQFNRVGDTFTYEIPVPIGAFKISFLFSENEYTAAGQRLFDMTIEGELLTNIDIYQMAGGAFRATRLQVFKVVDDRSLSIRFSRSTQFPNAGLPAISAIEVELDQPHVAHAVATGPYFGTVVNPLINKANVQLVGQTSHTHGEGLSLTNFAWKEGSTVLGTTVNTNFSFGVGLHTITLEVGDSGGNKNTEITEVTINPFGFPAITSLVPSSGNLTGLYPVIIVGSGFNYTASQIAVTFGTNVMTGSAITVINQTAIRVLAPSNVVAQATGVTVRTPIGTSISSDFNYVGSIPIQWQEIKLLEFNQPTVGRFGPDGKLYIGTRRGRLLKVTLNNDFTVVTNTIVSFVNPDNQEAMYVNFSCIFATY
jgi:Malectin domain